MSDFINLDSYFETNDANEKVRKPFTETKTSEDVHQCIAHNKGTGPVIDVFIGMYQEYLRQQWFHVATEYNERLQAVRDWNADKPVTREDDKGDPVVPEDRLEPEPPVQPDVPSRDDYLKEHEKFVEAAQNPLSRAQLYSLHSMTGSWHSICTQFLS